MSPIDYQSRYIEAVRDLMSRHDRDEAMQRAVGGNFTGFGQVMRECLIAAGLRPGDYLIDVGCGSGRLTAALKSYLTGRYLGLDVVPVLLEYARETAGRPDWRFEEAAGVQIPERDGTTDMVCFFSVLTHLLHEDAFRYLADAARVLKPGGTIVFTFLDFNIPSHWVIFDNMVEASRRGESTHHNQFMGRDMILSWAARLGLEVGGILDGDRPQLHLSLDVALDDGSVLPREACLGQSICVLRKGPMTTEPATSESTGSAFAVSSPPAASEEIPRRLALMEGRLAEQEGKISRLREEVLPLLHSRTLRIVRAVEKRLKAALGRDTPK